MSGKGPGPSIGKRIDALLEAWQAWVDAQPTPKSPKPPKKGRSRESLLADAAYKRTTAALLERGGDLKRAAGLRAHADELERRARNAPTDQ